MSFYDLYIYKPYGVKLSIIDKIVIGAAVSVVTLVSVVSILTEPVSKENVRVVYGHIRKIEKNRSSRGGLWYDLFITEDDNTCRIIADWIDCFDYDNFIKQVRSNQPIKISFRKSNGWMSSHFYMVTSVIVNDHDYMNVNCVNNAITNSRFEMPALAIGISIVGLLVYQYKKEKAAAKQKDRIF